MKQIANAVIMYPDDNVVTAITDLSKGEIVKYRVDDQWFEVSLIDNISFGHKLAVKEIKAFEPIVKYGENIGLATCDISAGEHVHVHNVDSVRGKGN